MSEHTTGPDSEELDEDPAGDSNDPLLPEPPHPINWNLLSADDAEAE